MWSWMSSVDELIQFIFLGTEASSSNIRRVQILQKDSSGPRWLKTLTLT
jgi:hypothetical protein